MLSTFYKVVGLLVILASAFFILPTLISSGDTLAVMLGFALMLIAYPGVVVLYVKKMFSLKPKQGDSK